MNEEAFTNILSHIRTQGEAQDVLTQLELFQTTLYSLKKTQLQDYFSRLPKEIADAIIEALMDKSLTENADSAHTFISQLQDKIRGCKIIQLTLAFHPDDATISLFSSWIKSNIGNGLILDIQVNKTVVGGTILVANGQYKDYSVRKKLSQVFQIQKEEIMGLLSDAQQ
jgi:F0F1-type ATP synthase delta subunit